MPNYIHHICLTVSNLKKSVDFYKKILGWQVLSESKEFAALSPSKKEEKNFMFGLGTYRDYKIPDNKFDRNRIGLDHFAFMVETRQELEKIEKRLKRLKIPMEDGGITDDGFGGTGIFTQDPDGMKVEWHLR
ncbi:MAG: hypothetical protein COX44_01845 [Candidatus Portnoybacteria bacterium CG23_combo_of_CG06-09_8_20_14_all_37_13]|uniref:VOC domain-containing protein n=1 Tax=Candidatus Portnoybacteria bacterium CG23_combo_of_CG06-09_8_20_14_all_37_13 TaxID=1974819 RepID=A0A2G9YEC5_9BACT|nr:MAG: hypothetical protein COX44_01845 [Candidatus Portnoybacteria bacterium CG23_combo_of_CG06-09_8_20_14_all_37_13]